MRNFAQPADARVNPSRWTGFTVNGTPAWLNCVIIAMTASLVRAVDLDIFRNQEVFRGFADVLMRNLHMCEH